MIKKSGYGILAAVTASVLESILFGYDYYIIFSLLLFFILASDIILFNKGPANDLFRVEVERRMVDPYGRKYQGKEVEVIFKNPTKRVITFHFYDTLSDIFHVKGDFDGDLALAAGEVRRLTYEISPYAIGKYQIGPLILYIQDPMKLCITRAVVPKIDEVMIGPAYADIHTQRSERLSNFLFTMGVHYSRKSGQGYDFYGIRPYVESDDFRYIAWNKYGAIDGDDLYIKQMEEERQIDVYFIIDYGVGMNQGTSEGRMYDRVVSAVLNASYSITKNRDGVGYQLMSSEIDEFIPAQKNQEPIKKLEKLVAGIRPGGQFNIEDAFDKIKERVRKNAVVFVITPFSFPEKFVRASGRRIHTGRPTYMFILDSYDFIEKREDDVYRKLLMSTRIKERRYLKAVTGFFNGVGVKTVISQDKDLLARVLAEYRYARMQNLGS